jgi:hypothetical protein
LTHPDHKSSTNPSDKTRNLQANNPRKKKQTTNPFKLNASPSPHMTHMTQNNSTKNQQNTPKATIMRCIGKDKDKDYPLFKRVFIYVVNMEIGAWFFFCQ